MAHLINEITLPVFKNIRSSALWPDTEKFFEARVRDSYKPLTVFNHWYWYETWKPDIEPGNNRRQFHKINYQCYCCGHTYERKTDYNCIGVTTIVAVFLLGSRPGRAAIFCWDCYRIHLKKD